jgi:lysophospholipase L1-like esterase
MAQIHGAAGRLARRIDEMLPLRRVAALLAAAALLACACAPEPAAHDAGALPTAATSAPLPAAAPIRYLALGDSFTIGTGSRPSESFPARLAARLRARGRAVELENLGVNGFTTDDLLERELPRVAPFAPTLVTLAVGANDLVRGSPPERYRAQVRRIFAAIAAAGVPADRVIVIPQPDWSLSPAAEGFGEPRALAGRIEGFNAILREEAASAGARFVDLFPLMRREAQAGMIAGDGLHPAAPAYDAWAAELDARLFTTPGAASP